MIIISVYIILLNAHYIFDVRPQNVSLKYFEIMAVFFLLFFFSVLPYLWIVSSLVHVHTNIQIHKRRIAKNTEIFFCRLNEEEKKIDEKKKYVTKDHDFVSFSSYSSGLIFIKEDFIRRSHANKIRFNHELMLLSQPLLLPLSLLMMHFKYLSMAS